MYSLINVFKRAGLIQSSHSLFFGSLKYRNNALLANLNILPRRSVLHCSRSDLPGHRPAGHPDLPQQPIVVLDNVLRLPAGDDCAADQPGVPPDSVRSGHFGREGVTLMSI